MSAISSISSIINSRQIANNNAISQTAPKSAPKVHHHHHHPTTTPASTTPSITTTSNPTANFLNSDGSNSLNATA